MPTRLMLERDDHLSCLHGLLAESLAGNGRIALVSGAAGTGKTELLTTFGEQAAADGAVFLSAIASPAERPVPFGVLDQLLRGARLPPGGAERIAGLLRFHAPPALGDFAPDAVDEPSARVLHGLCGVLLDLADRVPGTLLVGVDDVHHADAASLQCLAFLARRLRSARVLLVLTESAGPACASPRFHADLPGEPQCRRIRLDPLSEGGVAGYLARHLDLRTARRLAPDAHAASGGNPLLVRALVDDVRAAAPGEPQVLAVGAAFADAVLRCLHRGHPSVLPVARALAVLARADPRPGAADERPDPLPAGVGERPVTPDLLGDLLDLDAASVGRAVTALTGAGLVYQGRFRHPAARAAVLAAMTGAERVAMAGRAARLLHDRGAPACVVASALLDAAGPAPAWAVPVLREAAELALADGEVERTLGCLRLALGADRDERARARTAVRLTRVEWLVDPLAAARRTPELVEAVRDGLLPGTDALTAVGALLWFGHEESAVDALRLVDAAAGGLTPDASAALTAARTWLTCLYPSARHPVGDGAGEPAGAPDAPDNPQLQAAGLLADVLAGGSAATSAAAVRILETTRPDDRTLVPVVVALLAAIYSENLTVAQSRCDVLLADPATGRAPTWRALFAALRAEIAVRRGDLAVAERWARTALTAIPPRSWGVGVGLPLSTLVRASTAMGRYDAAAGHLATPVPEAMFRTPIGLRYLQARGRYHHAAGHLPAALDDFQSVGRMAAQWRLDNPVLVPWRSDAAQTLLCLGDEATARELAAEQVSRCGPGHVRVRAIALRVLAAATELPRRPVLLNQAVAALQGCDDRLEFASALTDLGWAYQALGNVSQARAMLRRANSIATRCGAGTLGSRPPAAASPTGPGTDAVTGAVTGTGKAAGPPDEDAAFALRPARMSDAERRVAVLAARGYTNRQIASKLFITVSTVEQHLTRVYRKLKVSCRSDLPLEFGPGSVSA